MHFDTDDVARPKGLAPSLLFLTVVPQTPARMQNPSQGVSANALEWLAEFGTRNANREAPDTHFDHGHAEMKTRGVFAFACQQPCSALPGPSQGCPIPGTSNDCHP